LPPSAHSPRRCGCREDSSATTAHEVTAGTGKGRTTGKSPPPVRRRSRWALPAGKTAGRCRARGAAGEVSRRHPWPCRLVETQTPWTLLPRAARAAVGLDLHRRRRKRLVRKPTGPGSARPGPVSCGGRRAAVAPGARADRFLWLELDDVDVRGIPPAAAHAAQGRREPRNVYRRSRTEYYRPLGVCRKPMIFGDAPVLSISPQTDSVRRQSGRVASTQAWHHGVRAHS